MKMRALANTGIELSCVGLGEMPLSLSTRPNEAQAISVVHAAVDAGMTWIDTADVYCASHRDIGHGERLVTTALKAMGDSGKDIVVATKGGLERPGGNWIVNGHPDHLHSACAASLRALRDGLHHLVSVARYRPEGPLYRKCGRSGTVARGGENSARGAFQCRGGGDSGGQRNCECGERSEPLQSL